MLDPTPARGKEQQPNLVVNALPSSNCRPSTMTTYYTAVARPSSQPRQDKNNNKTTQRACSRFLGSLRRTQEGKQSKELVIGGAQNSTLLLLLAECCSAQQGTVRCRTTLDAATKNSAYRAAHTK
uniref:Uncharacterized protein n=1 Tax=Physcomitrium patens TaxID=3218 RepID=A0A2K1KLB6_PHYPA|nr:hypothetical protein PHYPA_008247 [Physcomitrium patens]